MKTAVMVEHRNEYGEWVWYRVLLDCTPEQALRAYYEDKGEELPEIEESSSDFSCDDEVRAYRIPLETIT